MVRPGLLFSLYGHLAAEIEEYKGHVRHSIDRFSIECRTGTRAVMMPGQTIPTRSYPGLWESVTKLIIVRNLCNRQCLTDNKRGETNPNQTHNAYLVE